MNISELPPEGGARANAKIEPATVHTSGTQSSLEQKTATSNPNRTASSDAVRRILLGKPPINRDFLPQILAPVVPSTLEIQERKTARVEAVVQKVEGAIHSPVAEGKSLRPNRLEDRLSTTALPDADETLFESAGKCWYYGTELNDGAKTLDEELSVYVNGDQEKPFHGYNMDVSDPEIPVYVDATIRQVVPEMASTISNVFVGTREQLITLVSPERFNEYYGDNPVKLDEEKLDLYRGSNPRIWGS
jgi:hypothetical protein